MGLLGIGLCINECMGFVNATLLSSRWVLGLLGFHGNIMLLVLHKEIFG
jgi:hypothetical protein